MWERHGWPSIAEWLWRWKGWAVSQKVWLGCRTQFLVPDTQWSQTNQKVGVWNRERFIVGLSKKNCEWVAETFSLKTGKAFGLGRAPQGSAWFQLASRNWNRQGNGFFSRTSRRECTTTDALRLARWDSIQTSDFQNCKMINSCYLKLLSWW